MSRRALHPAPPPPGEGFQLLNPELQLPRPLPAVRLARLLPGASLADLTLPPRPALRAVVTVSTAAPPYTPPVDRAGLTATALAGLADIPVTLLDGHAGRPPATLANLTAALRDGAPGASGKRRRPNSRSRA